MKKETVFLMILLLPVLLVCQAYSASFTGLSDLPGVDFSSSSYATSSDGSVVVVSIFKLY